MSDTTQRSNNGQEPWRDDIIELQTKLQFQEDALQILDDVIIRQADALDRMQRQIDELRGRLEQWRQEGGEPAPPADEKPPHY